MKKIIIWALSGIVVFGSGMFLGKVDTVDKDTYENLKSKHEEVVKESDNAKKDLTKVSKELEELKKTDNEEDYKKDSNQIEYKEKKKTNISTEAISNTRKNSNQKKETKSSSSSSKQETKNVKTTSTSEPVRKPVEREEPDSSMDLSNKDTSINNSTNDPNLNSNNNSPEN
ncbi:hypothetical protein J0A94_03865 [Paraclostridium bifermentans]|uniref:Uncharacterized protein n=1 Tax=Paraclostridium bifermentans TaxID=1490 RepID=A0AA44DJN6_PARBF|nr:hypothetical protein [Paraclostridium bifermentans]MBN8046953.1 hypothetical protein [Paraclostridium bifermentans]NME08975.1 hypothetical protein [Paraclostridium bifermentans]